jgi:hypothetical protein
MDTAYLKRRLREETEAALRAAHPSAKRVHLELASRYKDLAAGTQDEASD